MKKDNEAEFIAEVKSKLPQVEEGMERKIIERLLEKLEGTDNQRRKRRIMKAIAEMLKFDYNISLSSLPMTEEELDVESKEIISDMSGLREDIVDVEEKQNGIAERIVELAKNNSEKKEKILAFARDYANKDLQELSYYDIEEEFEEIVRGEI
tara:strand:+ start:59 stop:517 length:459 start_codon:yes stop_codon:yes gene_type:complete